MEISITNDGLNSPTSFSAAITISKYGDWGSYDVMLTGKGPHEWNAIQNLVNQISKMRPRLFELKHKYYPV